MDLIIKIICLISIISFAFLDGWIDAYYWDLRSANIKNLSTKKDTHPERLGRRIIMGLPIILLLGNFYGIWWLILSSISFTLIFNFFHHGAMYTNRNKLNKQIYPKKWFAQSTSTKNTKFWTNILTPTNRTIMAIIGIMIYFLTLIIF